MFRSTAVTIFAGAVACASAQTPRAIPSRAPVTAPVAETSIFAPLARQHAPSAVRLATGAPGPKYWQNRADYDLHATLDTAKGTITGEMTLRYTNHSPDALPVLWFQTEQNGFRGAPGGDGAASPAAPYGDVIEQFTQVLDGRPVPVPLEEHGTETKATLARPLRPGETATFHVTWHFVVPPKINDMSNMGRAIMSLRMGRSEALYQVAQWYPRVNVYDDVKGWNTEPYDGTTEFYLEYGDFTLAVTVPATYIVAATGTLSNPQEVLTAAQRTRLALAAKADTVVHVVTAAELRDGTAHPRRDGMVTWTFKATNVRDAVFAASPDYQWDATHWQGVLTQAFYRPEAAESWHEVADMLRSSVQEYSEHWYPYPYPHISAAERIEHGQISGGMEYPMLSFDDGHGAPADLYGLITHEGGHNWFPMIVGSNERVHEWMDEGFNQFINSFGNARRYPEPDQNAQIGHQVYTGQERPIVGGSYNGTAYALQVLRRDILGPVVFDSAFRTYIKRWAFKHPTPTDFFRTMEDVSGRKLDWFWRGAILEGGRFDQAVDSVRQVSEQGKTRVTVWYENKGRMVMPLLVRVTFADGTTRDVTHPVDVWRANSAAYTTTYTFEQPVKQVTLDPDTHLPDADTSNNTWKAPGRP